MDEEMRQAVRAALTLHFGKFVSPTKLDAAVSSVIEAMVRVVAQAPRFERDPEETHPAYPEFARMADASKLLDEMIGSAVSASGPTMIGMMAALRG